MKKLIFFAFFYLGTILYAIECNEGGIQPELNQCAYESYQKADQELNVIYQKLKKMHQDDNLYLKFLTHSQRAWIKFRDAEIEMIFSCKEQDKRRCWGSMYPLLRYNEMETLTNERIKKLKRYLKEDYLHR